MCQKLLRSGTWGEGSHHDTAFTTLGSLSEFSLWEGTKNYWIVTPTNISRETTSEGELSSFPKREKETNLKICIREEEGCKAWNKTI